MIKDTLPMASLIGAVFKTPDICELCDEPFKQGQLIHTECITKKHDGKLPEGFAELIKYFKLDEPD